MKPVSCASQARVMTQMNPPHTLSSFSKLQFNIIPSPTPTSYRRSFFAFGVSCQNFLCFPPHASTFPFHLFLIGLIVRTRAIDVPTIFSVAPAFQTPQSYLEVVHTLHFVDITSLFEQLKTLWVKTTAMRLLPPHVSATPCHFLGEHKPSYL
jgi:hypothetical protein